MKKKKISIHDISRQLNISSATVSYVLNGKADEKRISEVLAKKILQYAEEAGYRPNAVAKSLRTGKSKTIGMLIEDISDPFFSSIARIVESIASRLGYKIFYASTEDDTIITKALIKVFRDAQVDGYIIVPPLGIEEDIQHLMDDNFPVVLFDRYFPALSTYNIVADNFGGAYQAAQHFLKQGFRHIGFVTLDSVQIQMHDRLSGYTSAISEFQIKPCITKVPFGLKHKEIVERIASFLEGNTHLDAVIFATNYLAIGGLEAIHTMGKKVPGDIAVIGFDDNTHFSLFSPSVTAVAQPVQEISEQVIEKLIACLNAKDEPPEKGTVVLPVRLYVRESSIPLKKQNL